MSEFRIERDSMGEVRVPTWAYYGAQTQRAVENFPVSGLRFERPFIRALGLIKLCAAEANRDLGLLDPRLAEAIIQAASEVAEGKHDEQFLVDIFQTGSGTSTNMNANEVIAGRANEILTGKRGGKSPVHPNDHVNKCQSSNDVIPAAMHVAALELLDRETIPAVRRLSEALAVKAKEFDGIVKIGRTHLMDATPIRLGQEFSGLASMLEHGVARLEAVRPHLQELALGGTAVGTGINSPPEFAIRAIGCLNERTKLGFRPAPNYFEALAARDAATEASAALRTVAISLFNVANNIRWLASGPRCGIAEIYLPELQPGSSIMPGKVNPVIPESAMQVAAQVVGNDATIAFANAMGSNFQLNVMKPVIAYNLLQSARLLAQACQLLRTKCVEGLQANEPRCREQVERSLAMCTALALEVGYDEAAKIAQEAYRTGKTVREIALQHPLLKNKPQRVAELLDPWRQTMPGLGLE
jgi:fumarate hydratase class II